MSGGELVEVVVGEPTETLLHTVSRDLDGDDDPVAVPVGLVEAWERAHETLYWLGETLLAYAQGRRHRDDPLPPHTVRPQFGDPRYCWNPVRHDPHTFRYSYLGHDDIRTGVYECDGDGRMAAAVLGVTLP